MAEDFADQFFIYKRTHSAKKFNLFLQGVNHGLQTPDDDGEYLRHARKRNSLPSTSSSSSSSSSTFKRQRTINEFIGADLFNDDQDSAVDFDDNFIQDGMEVGLLLKDALKHGVVKTEVIQELFDKAVARIPSGEKHVNLPDNSNLRLLFTFRWNNLFNPDAPLNDQEIRESSIFSNLPDFDSHELESPKLDINDFSIYDLTTTVFADYVDRARVQQFELLTLGESNSPLPTAEDIRVLAHFFKALGRGGDKEDQVSSMVKFILQCKSTSTASLFLEPFSRKYVYFLVRALATYTTAYNKNEDELDIDEDDITVVRDYNTFLKVWQLMKSNEQFHKKVALDNKMWNDAFDLHTTDDDTLRFYSRFVQGLENTFTHDTFIAYTTELGLAESLSKSPINFPVNRAMKEIKRIGRTQYELTLLDNLMSWLIEGDKNVRVVLHDVVMLKHCIEEAYDRMRISNDIQKLPPSQFVTRREFIKYLFLIENINKDAVYIRNYISVVKIAHSHPSSVPSPSENNDTLLPSSTNSSSSSSSSSSGLLDISNSELYSVPPSFFRFPSPTGQDFYRPASQDSQTPTSDDFQTYTSDDSQPLSFDDSQTLAPEHVIPPSPPFLDPRIYDDDDDDDDWVGEDILLPSSSSSSSSSITPTYPNPLTSRLEHGIIVREVSYLDNHRRHHPRRRRHLSNHSDTDDDGFYHVAAYKNTAVGCNIGHASYDVKAKKVVDFDYTEDRVRAALIGAIHDAHPHVRKDDIVIPLKQRIGDDLELPSSSSSMTTPLTLDLSFTYDSKLAETGQTNETPHVLMFWLSRSYSDTPPIVVNVEETRKSRLTMTFNVDRDYIPENVSLNIDSYSHFTSETGNSMRNLAGSAHVALADLLRNSSVTLNLRVAASDAQIIKGVLVLRCNTSSLLPRASHNGEHARDDTQSTIEHVKNYITDNRRFYDSHPPISRSIMHTTVFKFRCRQNYVPGVLFDNFRIPQSQETYYLNALKNALQLRLPQSPIINIEEAWHRVDSKLYTVLSMLTSYAVACKYLRDSVDNNVKGTKKWDASKVEEIDSFDTVRHTDNGDCEDKTKEILLHVMELKHNSKDFQSPLFPEIREILDNYVFCSTLCAVSHSSISKTDFDERREVFDMHMNAHECAVAIPNYTFFSALRRNSPKHKLFDLYTQEEQDRGKGDRLYILEGTGSLVPEPRESTEYRDNIQIAYENGVSHRHLSNQIFYEIESDDAFYKIIVNLMTPEFYLRTGYVGFEFLVINDKGERGAFFSDLMNITSNTKVMITETPRLTPLTFNRSMRVTEDNFPLVMLEAPLEIPRMILNTAKRLTFRTTESRAVVPRHEDCFIVQCLFEYMTEEKILSIIKGAQAQQLNVVCYVEALKLDYVTKRVFGRYTLIFY